MTLPEAMESGTDLTSPARVAVKLFQYCKSCNWAGYDPYDGLNSRIFQALRFLHFKYPRLALIQLMKRSPINFRRLLLVPKEQNPKGIALFLSAAVKLRGLGIIKDDAIIRELAETLIRFSILGNGYSGWGYNFDWQTRGVLVPRGTPNIICTTFAANALLDAYKHDPDPRFLEMAVAAAKFLHDRLYIEPDNSKSLFVYTPLHRGLIHNANFLGSALLCRVALATENKTLLPAALKAARLSVAEQHADGSWDYGESKGSSQRWIDNFHTGFNLCALRHIANDAETSEFEPHIKSGFDFYRQHFFGIHGQPKYYHDRVYPIDIHSAAQSIITLITFRDQDENNRQLANAVMSWTITNMRSDRGYFYYQKHPHWTIIIPYMRWSQAWMLLALATLLESGEEGSQQFL